MGRDRQRLKNEETRKAILDTAIKIAIREGFDSLSIRKITNTLGYSAGIIYYYFKDRQDIIDAIHEESSQWIKSEIMKIICPEKGFEYNTKTIFHMILTLALEDPEKYNLLVYEKFLKNKESINSWISMVEKNIQMGIATGELRQMDCRIAAYNVWTAFLGLIIVINQNKEITKEYAYEIFDHHLEIIMNGMKPRNI